MAWYYGTYSCGHEGRVNVVGKGSDRQWKVERHFEGICDACLQKQREEENQKATALAGEYGFPELTGTEKQIAWANSIRMEFYEACIEENCIPDVIITKETSAKFWIDNRDYLHDSDFLEHYQQKCTKEKQEKALIDADTVRPVKISHPGVVEIVERMNCICVIYEKDQDFMNLVKSYHYRWDGLWCRSLKETTGPFGERAAEIGHALLKNGFSICIHDPEILEKAISGDFEPEHTRWIYSRVNSSLLAINWMGRNEELYRMARKIKGSKWDGQSVVVDVSHHHLVEEFAFDNGFRFTAAAEEKIKKYEEELKNTRKVDVK